MNLVIIKNRLFIVAFLSLFQLFFSQKKDSSISFNKLEKDTTNYFSKKVDLNLDGKTDIIFINKWLAGNNMYFFLKVGNNYKLVLKTINFTEDGIFELENVEIPNRNKNNIVLKLHTINYDKQNIKSIFYIQYKNDEWYLKKIFYTARIPDFYNKIINYQCTYNPNILLSENVDYKLFDSKDKNCIKN